MMLDYIYLLNIILIFNFENLLVTPSYVTPSSIDLLLTYKMSTSYTNSLLRLGLSTILQSDWSRVSWAITQDLEFCQS